MNFDQQLERRGTNSMKWDARQPKNIPMWVADMDFQSPLAVQEALQAVANSGVYGYAWPPSELFEVILERLEKMHAWNVEKEWIVLLPGLVPGLHASARIMPSEKKSTLTSTPVYYHLYKAAESSGLETLEVPFLENGEMDFEGLKAKKREDTGMYFLCNPHNPTGRVFSQKELEKLADFCLKENLILVSDEIHCDLILDHEKRHHSVASFSKEVEDNSITLLSPSKTFNIAGIGGSFAVIPNGALRSRFEAAKFGIMPHLNNWQISSMLAAYQHGEPWRQELLAYLRSNHNYLLEEINAIPELKMKPLDATYLAMIQCPQEDPEKYLSVNGIDVNGSGQFHGTNFFRLNFGTQKSRLEEGVKRIKEAYGN